MVPYLLPIALVVVAGPEAEEVAAVAAVAAVVAAKRSIH
jgi:hypothetical protein